MTGLERALARRGVNAALVLGLVGCTNAGADLPEAIEDPPACRDGFHELPAGFELERPVDYVGDYWMGEPIAESGELCSGAAMVVRCEDAVAEAQNFAELNLAPRTLITTEGDQVRLWSGGGVLALFGDIDTPEEALFFAATVNLGIDCSTRIVRTREGFRLWVRNAESVGCVSPLPADGRIDLLADGRIRSMGVVTTFDANDGCSSTGI